MSTATNDLYNTPLRQKLKAAWDVATGKAEVKEDENETPAGDPTLETEQAKATEPDDTTGAPTGQEADSEKVSEATEAEQAKATEGDRAVEGAAPDADETGSEPQKTEATETTHGNLEPLKHWSEADQEFFRTLPEKAQEFQLRRDKMFQDNARAAEEQWAGVRKAIDPIRQDLVESGLDDAEITRRFVATHVGLASEDPQRQVQSALNVLNAYGISVEALSDPSVLEVSESDKRVAAVEERQAAQERAAMEARQQQGLRVIEEFRTSGKAEFFDEVYETMEHIGRNEYLNTGTSAPPIEELYEIACLRNPAIKPRYLQSQISAERTKADEAERAEKAKAASETDLESTPSTEEPVSYPTNLRDQLAHNIKKAGGLG
jgi:hypothetical protein